MRKPFMALLGLTMLVAGATSAEAGCTGGIGSDNLDCTSNAGTLNDFKSWVMDTYVPAAITKAMSAFAQSYNSANEPGMTGYSQIADEWSQWSKRAVDIVQITIPATGTTQVDDSFTKSVSSFTIDGYNSGGGANVWFRIYWTGTIAETVDGVTNYIASYNYDVSGAAWGATNIGGSVNWLPNATIDETVGSGTFALTNNVAAVPGPEAGAGLAGLVMAGAGAYMLRRRRPGGSATA